METVEFTLTGEESALSHAVAELESLGFHGFWEDGGLLRAYIHAKLSTPDLESLASGAVSAVGARLNGTPVRIDSRNWNESWERSIKPVVAGPFLIRTSWHERAERSGVEIIIDPKMSFGTGHHETTRLALAALRNRMKRGHRVLDAGSGTGILAIAAAKLEAASVLAFDNDEWAVLNGRENIERNAVEDVVRYVLGSAEVAANKTFDLILANINRVVLSTMMTTFQELVDGSGSVVVTGILARDADATRSDARGAGFDVEAEATQGEWWCSILRKA